MARLFTSDALYAADSQDWVFGGGDFAISTMVNFVGTTGAQIIASQYYQTGNRGWYYRFFSNQLQFFFSTGSGDGTGKSVAWSPGTATWYHILVTRIGNDLFFYVDGAQQGATQDCTGLSTADVTQELGIGAFEATGPVWSSFFNGHIAEVAIWKGRGLVVGESVGLGKGFSSKFYSRGFTAHWPLIRGLNDVVSGQNLTASGTVVSDHPRIILPHGLQ